MSAAQQKITHSGWAPAIALLGLLHACGASGNGTTAESAAEDAQGAVRRISLKLEGAALTSTEPILYRRLKDKEDAAWIIAAQKTSRGAIPGLVDPRAQNLILMLDTKAKRIVLPGPFDAQAFNRLELEVVVRQEGEVSARFLRGTEVVAESHGIGINPRFGLQRVLVHLEAPGTEAFDAIELAFDANCGPMALGAVSLEQASPLASLELMPGERGLAQRNDSARLAYGISTEHALIATFHVLPGDQLRMSARLTSLSAGERAQARLVIELSSHGVDSVTPLSGDLPPDAGWQTVLQGQDVLLASGEYDMRLRLESEHPGPVYALIEQPTLHAPKEDAPVVLLITSDTHRGDHLGSAKDGVHVKTPTIDALGARGLFFERAYASSNITLPSHVALLTGTSPRDTGVRTNLEGLAESAPTLADAYRDAGWSTLAALSARHLYEVGGTGQGFDRVSAPLDPERPGSRTLERIEDWLPDYEGRPLFIWLHLFDPHSPYAPPKEYSEYYVERLRKEHPGADAKIWNQRARYRGEVSYLDSLIARAFTHPRLAGATIAFTGDHGENLGEHGLMFNHAELYPEVLHVPLIVAWPGGPVMRIAEPISHLGLGRMLLDLSELGAVDFPGTSFWGFIAADSSTAASRKPVFALADAGRSASITMGSEHLILHLVDHPAANDRQAVHGQTELYDLESDPGCEHDLLTTRPDRVRGLRGMLVRWLSSTRDLGWVSGELISEEQKSVLAELGYTDLEAASDGALIDPDCECEWCVRWR